MYLYIRSPSLLFIVAFSISHSISLPFFPVLNIHTFPNSLVTGIKVTEHVCFPLRNTKNKKCKFERKSELQKRDENVVSRFEEFDRNDEGLGISSAHLIGELPATELPACQWNAQLARQEVWAQCGSADGHRHRTSTTRVSFIFWTIKLVWT